jgi:hypothetical protein
MRLLFSKKLWDKTRKDGDTNLIINYMYSLLKIFSIFRNTDWRINKKEKLEDYLNRQLDSINARRLYESKEHIIKNLDSDDIIVYWQSWVNTNIIYKTDWENFKCVEVWEDLDILLERSCGDCESMNTLVYVLCRFSGIPAEMLYLVGGYVSVGSQTEGHVWLKAISEYDGNERFVDTTYYPDFRPLNERGLINRNYKDEWWRFNEFGCYKMR